MGIRMRGRGTTWRLPPSDRPADEATGPYRDSAGVLAGLRAMAGHELTPSCRVLRVSGRYPNGTRRRRRLGRAASLPRDRTRPDRRSRGTPKCTFAELHRSPSRTTVVDARERQGRAPTLASSRAIVYLDPRHSWNRGAEDERPTNGTASWASAPRPVRPEENGASRDRRSIERTEVAAVEASRGDRPGRTPLPFGECGNHARRASRSHRRRHPPQCGEHATHKDAISELADEIARNGGYRLEEVSGRGEVSPTSGKGSDDRRQPENDQIAGSRRRLGDEIHSNGHTRRRVPDHEQRRLLRDRRRNDQGNSDSRRSCGGVRLRRLGGTR